MHALSGIIFPLSPCSDSLYISLALFSSRVLSLLEARSVTGLEYQATGFARMCPCDPNTAHFRFRAILFSGDSSPFPLLFVSVKTGTEAPSLFLSKTRAPKSALCLRGNSIKHVSSGDVFDSFKQRTSFVYEAPCSLAVGKAECHAGPWRNAPRFHGAWVVKCRGKKGCTAAGEAFVEVEQKGQPRSDTPIGHVVLIFAGRVFATRGPRTCGKYPGKH